MPHDRVVDQTQHQPHGAHPEGDVPAEAVRVLRVEVILEPWREELGDHRAEIHGHVIDRERAVDSGVVALVDLAHQIAGIGLEQTVADHDHAERAEQEPHVLSRHHHQRIAHRENRGAEQHRPAAAEDLVADPPADGRRHVNQRGGRAPHDGRTFVREAQALDHVVHDQRLHAVVAEAFPHLDEEHRGEASGLGDRGRCIHSCRLIGVADLPCGGQPAPPAAAPDT